MAYEKQNFEPGKILTAAQMNHIEDGIEAVEKGMPTSLPNPGRIRFMNKSDGSQAVQYDGSSETEVALADDAHIESVAKPLITWENLLDKPFGQISYDGIALDTTRVAIEDGVGPIDMPFTLKDKANYMVAYIVNNATSYYSCTGVVYTVEGMEMVWLGNLQAVGAGNVGNPDAPFLIGCVPAEMVEDIGGYGIVLDLGGNTSVSVAIQSIATYAPMDEALIPDTIARLSQVEEMIDAKLAQLKSGS